MGDKNGDRKRGVTVAELPIDEEKPKVLLRCCSAECRQIFDKRKKSAALRKKQGMFICPICLGNSPLHDMTEKDIKAEDLCCSGKCRQVYIERNLTMLIMKREKTYSEENF